MKLLRWMSMVGAGALTVVISVTAEAQTCNGSRFATCATVTAKTAALEALLLGLWEPAPRNALDRVFAQADKEPEAANNGCPSPNGEHGAESVAEHNPHCNGTAESEKEREGPPESAGLPPDFESLPQTTSSVTPEPASIVLLGTALLTLGAGAFSRRKRA